MELRDFKIIAVALSVGLLFLCVGFLLLLYTGRLEWKNLPGERRGGVCTDTPQFYEYHVPPSAFSTTTTVNFESRPEALRFKTAISDWFNKGPQSGRFYVIAGWGCGSGCQAHAIIDSRDGKITAYGLPTSDGIAYNLDSNLLVLNPPWNVENTLYRPAPVTSEFYELKNGIPKLICTINYPPLKD